MASKTIRLRNITLLFSLIAIRGLFEFSGLRV